MSTALERRRATYLRGHFAEHVALALLLAKGYRLLARRYASSGGEIDLIVKRGDTIVFVEVKARGLIDDALGAIGANKRERFSRAARAWVTATVGPRARSCAPTPCSWRRAAGRGICRRRSRWRCSAVILGRSPEDLGTGMPPSFIRWAGQARP
jgi:putative endonuclease